MAEPTRPFTTWSGIEIHTDDGQALAEITKFFESDYLAAITSAHPSLVEVQRYELLATDRHGGFGAKLLTALTWGGDPEVAESAGQSVPSLLPDAPAAWRDGTSTSWSLLYRYLAETGPAFESAAWSGRKKPCVAMCSTRGACTAINRSSNAWSRR